MSKSFFEGIALIATAVAAACKQAATLSDCSLALPSSEPAAPAATPEPEAPKKPGRPKKGAPAPAAAPEPTPTAAPEPEPAAPAAASEGKTLDELKEVIRPLVEGGQGNDVKAVIAKYGVTKLAELVPLTQHHAAFIKDIEALSI